VSFEIGFSQSYPSHWKNQKHFTLNIILIPAFKKRFKKRITWKTVEDEKTKK
jgi:hypothetical protein